MTHLDPDGVAALREVVGEDDEAGVGADEEEGADAEHVPPDGAAAIGQQGLSTSGSSVKWKLRLRFLL